MAIDVDPVDPDGAHPRPSDDRAGGEVQPALLRPAAALAFGRVGIDTFEGDAMRAPEVVRLVPRVTMRADERLGRESPPLTEARGHGAARRRPVAGALRPGRPAATPTAPASQDELDGKFLTCARRAVSPRGGPARRSTGCGRLDAAASVAGPFGVRLAAAAPEPQPV